MTARIWEKLTVEEFSQALRETPTVLLPLGVCEQHGFHLPLATDIYNAEHLSRRASEETGCLVAPTLKYAFSGGELPGTINLSPQAHGVLLLEILRELYRNGLTNVILVPGHGGTDFLYGIQSAATLFLRLNPQYADRNLAICLWWDYSPEWQEKSAAGDYHAAEVETSLMAHWVPDEVRWERMTVDEPEFLNLMRTDCDAYEEREQRVDDPMSIPRRFQSPRMKVGVMGWPERAAAATGARISEQCVAGLVELIRKIQAAR
jgi:creatinine amidohydrolase